MLQFRLTSSPHKLALIHPARDPCARSRTSIGETAPFRARHGAPPTAHKQSVRRRSAGRQTAHGVLLLTLLLVVLHVGGSFSSLQGATHPEPPAQDQADTESAPAAGTEPSSEFIPGQVLVGFSAKATATLRARAANLVGVSTRWIRGGHSGNRPWSVLSTATGSAGSSSASSAPGPGLALISLKPEVSVRAAIAELRRLSGVAFAEPNYRIQLAAGTDSGTPTPSDFRFREQWPLLNTGQPEGIAGADIGALAAWQRSTGSRRVLVAIIDSGIDYLHPDLRANLWVNSRELPGNGIDEDENGYLDDVHGYDFVSDDSDPFDDLGHGTHVAGIVGAVGDNGIGVSGVCWEVSLMALKAFDETGSGDVASVVAALDYARAAGARVINASWGLTARSRALREAIEAAQAAGALVVAAAGNKKIDTLLYPARYQDVLAIASIDRSNQRSSFSNWGLGIDLAAPGDSVLSTAPNNAYEIQGGTSMAAPHVSGTAALLWASHPDFTRTDITAILLSTATPIFADKPLGRGRLNAAAALAIEQPLPRVRLDVPDAIGGRIDLPGSIAGDDVAGYAIVVGQGPNPETWTALHEAVGAPDPGPLWRGWDTSLLEDGDYTLQVVATNQLGQIAIDRKFIRIRNVFVANPLNNDILRRGDRLEIRGTVYGAGRRYTLEHGRGAFGPLSWSSAGIQLPDNPDAGVVNGVLGWWDTSQVEPDEFHTLRLRVTDGAGSVREHTVNLLYADGQLRPGWPRHIPIVGEFPEDDWREIEVADLDGDGLQELLIVDPGDEEGKMSTLRVYRHDGSLAWTRDLDSGAPYSDRPLAGDIDGDGRREVFVDAGAAGLLYAFRHDGTPLGGGWPARVEAGALAKVLADLDHDGRMELITLSQGTVDRSGAPFQLLSVFDAQGGLRALWNIQHCTPEPDAPRRFPAVGNLDDDPDLEIAVAVPCLGLSAYDLAEPRRPLWNSFGDGRFEGSPVIGDLDGDGTNEVVVASFGKANENRGGVYVFTGRGALWPGWPVLIEESFLCAPALADFDGDGKLEISIPSWDSRRLHLLRADGFEVPGWPVGPIFESAVKSSTVIGDLDRDGFMDVILASPGYMYLAVLQQDITQVAGVKAWSFHGHALDLNPNPKLTALAVESSNGNAWSKSAPATLTDLDGNGRLDIVVASIQDRTYLPAGQTSSRKNRSTLHVWELPAPFAPERMPWPRFQGNAEHTGFFTRPTPPPATPVVLDIPNQIARTGTAFLPIRLDHFVRDADNQPAEMTWTVTATPGVIVTVDDRRIAHIDPVDAQWTGSASVRFTATDPGGRQGAATATFTSRADYVPPAALPDEATTLEDEIVELEPLANDRHPRGLALALSSLGRPSVGHVERLDANRFRFVPPTDFNGQATLDYTISDPEGGFSEASIVIRVLPVADAPTAQPDRVITTEDLEVHLDPIANDFDADQDSLAITGIDTPQYGTLERADAGGWVYRPAPDFSGIDRFAYHLVDATGLPSTGEVSVLVKPVNDAPRISGRTFVINRNTEAVANYLGLDADKDELTYKIVQGPANGEFWTYPTFGTYYPRKGFVGTDSVTYQASDGRLDSEIATFVFEVLATNNPPKLDPVTLTTKPNRPLRLQLVAQDADDDPVTYEVTRPPSHGRLEGTAPDWFYHPAADYLGQDSFALRASDPLEQGPETEIAIRVTDVNTPPVTADAWLDLTMNTATNLAPTATDGEHDELTWTILEPPRHGRLSAPGARMDYTPNLDYTGPDSFTYQVSDGIAVSPPARVYLNIRFPNKAPIAQELRVNLYRDESIDIRLPVVDPDNDPLISPILKGPRQGRLYGSGVSFRYTPRSGFSGQDQFTFKAWDGRTYSAEGKVIIQVSFLEPPTPPGFDTIEPLAGVGIRMHYTVQPGRPYTIQSSSNLADWRSVHQATAGSAKASFTDTNAPAIPQQFYRILQQ